MEGDHTAGVDMECFSSLQHTLHYGASGVDEAEAVPFELLHDKAFPAEESGQDLALKVDPDGDPFCSTEKTVFLTNQAPTHVGKVYWENISGIRCPEGDVGLARRACV